MTVLQKSCILIASVVSFSIHAVAQSTIAKKFDVNKMQFEGTKVDQAAYLLRYVKKYAHLDDVPRILPGYLDSILSDNVKLTSKRKLQRYLDASDISNLEIGGSLDSPICSVAGKKASYFVIHDTSNFLTGFDKFPTTIDSASWSGNRLDNKVTFANAHLFINRLGASITSNDLSKPIRGTKFENPIKNPQITSNILGTFIHIELVQPRLPDPGKKNDAIAVDPGFTAKQYQRLALIYLAASIRKGDWLVPTFHAVLDEGIPDGHDDPQHFELERFVVEVGKLIGLLK